MTGVCEDQRLSLRPASPDEGPAVAHARHAATRVCPSRSRGSEPDCPTRSRRGGREERRSAVRPCHLCLSAATTTMAEVRTIPASGCVCRWQRLWWLRRRRLRLQSGQGQEKGRADRPRTGRSAQSQPATLQSQCGHGQRLVACDWMGRHERSCDGHAAGQSVVECACAGWANPAMEWLAGIRFFDAAADRPSHSPRVPSHTPAQRG